MVAGVLAGNISAEATTPTGNIFPEAMRGHLATVPRGLLINVKQIDSAVIGECA